MTAHWTVKNASGELLANFSSVSPLEVARKVVPDALSVLWGWFLVPVFNLPPPSVAQAIGIALVVTYRTNHQKLDLYLDRARRRICCRRSRLDDICARANSHSAQRLMLATQSRLFDRAFETNPGLRSWKAKGMGK